MKRLLLVLITLASSLAVAEQRLIPMQTHGAQTYYINSEILGAGQYSMLVDTGSAYSVINEETLADLSSKGQAHFVKKLRGQMADGSERVIPLYRIAAINLGGSCLIKNIHAAVLPGKARQIIGVSTLMRAAPFAMSFDPPTLSLNHCTAPIQQASLEVGALESGLPKVDTNTKSTTQ